jgi:hypothetical protein
MIKAFACGTLGAALLAVGCQSNLALFGPVQPDEPGPPPGQPQIEPFNEVMPQAAYGPVGPLRDRRLVARLRLSPPNDAYSLFMSEVRNSKLREKSIDLYFRCQSIYVARTESLGEDGTFIHGGAPGCAVGADVRPSWVPLGVRQISCQYDLQLTAGTVSADLDGLRLTFSSGAVRTYRLDGPLLANAPHRRVFLLDHGALEWTLAEGLKEGRAVASQTATHRYCD